MQTGHRTQNRNEHQRHHHHLQQLDIAITDDVKPADRLFYHCAVFAVDQLQNQAEQHADHQTGQHFFRQAPVLTAEAGEQYQQHHKGHDIERKRKVHTETPE